MGSVPAGEEVVVPDGEVIVAGDELPPVREDGGVILGGNPMLSGGDFLEDQPSRLAGMVDVIAVIVQIFHDFPVKEGDRKSVV